MAHNQGPEQTPDPAGNTQMFRAFVDEEAPRQGGVQQPATSSGPRVGVIVGVVVAIVVIAAVVWLAVG